MYQVQFQGFYIHPLSWSSLPYNVQDTAFIFRKENGNIERRSKKPKATKLGAAEVGVQPQEVIF